MSNALYDTGRNFFLVGGIDWDTDSFKLVFIDEDSDAVVLTTDDNLDDIGSGARIAISGSLTCLAPGAGIADANDITVNTVTGAQFESLTIYKDSGTESTSHLVCNIDTATGLPMTPNGGNITVAWDNGTNKIFKL